MKIRKLFTVAALTAILLAGACDQVNFTAPTGSVITLTVQPQTIAVNGFANLTVTGTRESGAPLPDGTTIDFTSDLGTVTPNPVETKDGVARTQLKAGTRSGTAHVTARSGSAAEVSVDVIVGEARAARLSLVASPIQLPIGGGKVNLKAHVFDESGNTLGGVGVIFTSTAGELESRGRVLKTNDSGTAFDTLTTSIASSITAETQNGTGTDTADITIGERPACDFVFSPVPVVVGEPVTFSDITGNTTGLTFLWDFGDGATDEGQTVVHTFDAVATFDVVHTVIDSQGLSVVCHKAVEVTRGAPVCNLTAFPSPATEGSPVAFSGAGSDDPSGIRFYNFAFGDGTETGNQTGNSASHTYNFAPPNDCPAQGVQNLTPSLTVTDNQGQTTTCTINLTVDCI